MQWNDAKFVYKKRQDLKYAISYLISQREHQKELISHEEELWRKGINATNKYYSLIVKLELKGYFLPEQKSLCFFKLS